MSVDHIHWLGHASFRLDDGAAQIYIDPWKLPAGAPKADVILITHAHFDHYSPEDIAKIEQPGTAFVAPADVAAKLKGKAAAANLFKPTVLIPMHWGDIVGSKADAETVKKVFTGTTVIKTPER